MRSGQDSWSSCSSASICLVTEISPFFWYEESSGYIRFIIHLLSRHSDPLYARLRSAFSSTKLSPSNPFLVYRSKPSSVTQSCSSFDCVPSYDTRATFPLIEVAIGCTQHSKFRLSSCLSSASSLSKCNSDRLTTSRRIHLDIYTSRQNSVRSTSFCRVYCLEWYVSTRNSDSTIDPLS